MSTEASTEEAVSEQVADFIFGKEPEAQEPEQTEYEPSPEPVEEGAEGEPEEVEAQEQETEEAETDLVEVEWEGQLIEAPKSVADALMRQSDYTKKTQEVATQRKEIQAQMATLEQTRADFEFAQSANEDISKIQQIDTGIEQYRQYMRENVDSMTPVDFQKAQLMIDEAQAERAKLVDGLQTKQQEFQQAREQSITELLKQGTEVLRGKIPEWGEDHQKQVREYALAQGFSEQEIATVVDPRQVEILYKASQYDALQAGKKPAVLKAQSAIKPKSRNPMPKDVQDKLNLRKKLKSNKLSNQDKADLVGDSIARKFNM